MLSDAPRVASGSGAPLISAASTSDIASGVSACTDDAPVTQWLWVKVP